MRTNIAAGLLMAGFLALLAAQTGETAGEKIYAQHCLSCHAKDGSGSTPRGKAMKVPDLRAAAIQKKTDAQLVEAIVKAKAHAAFRKKISDADMKQAVEFMRKL
jgi:mono/diheme cytochrome c family protein